jgi:predicted transcriptional regulator of viral defense system
MKWEDFIQIAGKHPVVETKILLTGFSHPSSLQVHIGRWEKAGKLIKVKRGVYLLATPYRRIELWEPYLASMLKRPSYLSLEKALEFHQCIPEAVPRYTSVTPKRQATFSSPAGIFSYRHIDPSLFWGYEGYTVRNQTALIASPEKALLDLVYLYRRKLPHGYIRELRLQNMEKFDLDRLLEYAGRFKKPGIIKAADSIRKHLEEIVSGEKELW